MIFNRFMFITTSLLSLIYGGALEASGKDAKLPEDLKGDSSRSTPSMTLTSPDKKEDAQKPVRSLTHPFEIPYINSVSDGLLNMVEITQKTINVRVWLNEKDKIESKCEFPVRFPVDLLTWLVTGTGEVNTPGFGCLEYKDGLGGETLKMAPHQIRKGLLDLISSLEKELLGFLPNSSSTLSSASSSSSSFSSVSSSSAASSSAPVLVFSSSSSMTSDTTSSFSSGSSSSSVSVSTSLPPLPSRAVLKTLPSVYSLSDIETQIKAIGGTTQKVYRKKSKLSHIKVDVKGHTQTFYPVKNPTEGKKLQRQFISFWKEIGE